MLFHRFSIDFNAFLVDFQWILMDFQWICGQFKSELPRKVLDAEPVSGVAASWWLAAVAMSGLELEAAAGKPEARPAALEIDSKPIENRWK